MSWFERAFGPRYLQLYAHRSREEAARALDALFDAGELRGRRVLDLACGAGRHVAELLAREAWPVGLDLSSALLAAARQELPSAPLVRADMRFVPLRERCVDFTLSMFTSFGYFERDEEHALLAAEMARVTRRGVMLDVPNPVVLRRALVPRSERRVRDWLVRERRWIEDDPPRVCKTMHLVDAATGVEVDRFEERVRLFSGAELDALFAPVGFRAVRRRGHYDGSEFDGEESERLLVRFERIVPARDDGPGNAGRMT